MNLHCLAGQPHDDFFINSIPKCGTHYLMNCLLHLFDQNIDEGYGWITEANYSEEHHTAILNTLEVVKAHNRIHKMVVPYFSAIEQTLIESQHKWLFMMRDPRDALVSLLLHMEALKSNGDRRDFMVVDSSAYDHLSVDNKLTALMTGLYCQNYLVEFYRPMMKWAYSPYGLTIRFEDLVGDSAGGSDTRQLETFMGILNYLNSPVDVDQLHCAIASSYSPWMQSECPPEMVHQRGQIGSWRRFFKDYHKSLFKILFGKELIQLGYEDNADW